MTKKLGSGLFLLVYDPKKQKNAILAYLQKMQETPVLRSLGAPLIGNHVKYHENDYSRNCASILYSHVQKSILIYLLLMVL